jgi:hypothetical protein
MKIYDGKDIEKLESANIEQADVHVLSIRLKKF